LELEHATMEDVNPAHIWPITCF